MMKKERKKEEQTKGERGKSIQKKKNYLPSIESIKKVILNEVTKSPKAIIKKPIKNAPTLLKFVEAFIPWVKTRKPGGREGRVRE